MILLSSRPGFELYQKVNVVRHYDCRIAIVKFSISFFDVLKNDVLFKFTQYILRVQNVTK